jgi:hypothetical protein
MDDEATVTAFAGERWLAAGAPVEVAVAVKHALAQDAHRPIAVFDDTTGGPVDFDLRGSDDDVRARLTPAAPPRPPGRPRLGVTAREVTLLPRHWEWLAAQPGGISVTLRKLVDGARTADGDAGRARRAQQAADRFMSATLGNQPGYEEASRALYAGNGPRFTALMAGWPQDLRAHAERLAAPAFIPAG